MEGVPGACLCEERASVAKFRELVTSLAKLVTKPLLFDCVSQKNRRDWKVQRTGLSESENV